MKKYIWIRHYIRCFLQSLLRRPAAQPIADMIFVVPLASRGWILDAICKELCQYYPARSLVFYSHASAQLPPAKAYFFVHYNMLFSFLSRQPQVWRAKRYVWYTHNSDSECGGKQREIPWVLNRMHKIFTTNSRLHAELARQGVAANKLHTLLGAADPKCFQPHSRKGRTVGISTAYYERKNPALIKAIVQAMTDTQFILLGKDWHKWPHFSELMALPNIEYVTAKYADYPGIYQKFDVFLSTSTLEGGPIPLVETMMCNIVPVVSDTGFCRDIIREGENGFIFSLQATVPEVVAKIEQALKFNGDISHTVKNLSWENMSVSLHRAVGCP